MYVAERLPARAVADATHAARAHQHTATPRREFDACVVDTDAPRPADRVVCLAPWPKAVELAAFMNEENAWMPTGAEHFDKSPGPST